jgi:subtilisin family serine protease
VRIGTTSGADDGNYASPVVVAVIDGPYDAAALSRVLAYAPVSLAGGTCGVSPNSACDHGTFIIGLLGAREDAMIPGLCPDCRLIHVPLFIDMSAPWASVDELATAIVQAVTAGARLINLSLAILGADSQNHPGLAAALNHAERNGAVLLVAAGNQGRLAMGQLLSHPIAIPVVGVDASQRLLPDSNFGPAISRRGVAALGRMPGYAPGGGTTAMSGTSVATAVATGTLAQV